MFVSFFAGDYEDCKVKCSANSLSLLSSGRYHSWHEVVHMSKHQSLDQRFKRTLGENVTQLVCDNQTAVASSNGICNLYFPAQILSTVTPIIFNDPDSLRKEPDVLALNYLIFLACVGAPIMSGSVFIVSSFRTLLWNHLHGWLEFHFELC